MVIERALQKENVIEELEIIDPTKVVKTSLIYGTSLASILVSVGSAVLHHDHQILVEHDEMKL